MLFLKIYIIRSPKFRFFQVKIKRFFKLKIQNNFENPYSWGEKFKSNITDGMVTTNYFLGEESMSIG